MIPNRVFVALFGAALLASAVYHATVRPVYLGAVILPAIGGLFLINLAVRIGRHGARGRHVFCGARAQNSGDTGTAGQAQ
jgi:hypothetical protein